MGNNDNSKKDLKPLPLSQQKQIEDKKEEHSTYSKRLEEKLKELREEEKLISNLLSHTFVTSNNQHNIYDIRIDVDSFNNLEKGWKIEANPKSLEIYKEKKDKNSCVISIMGNIKKGKSFILSHLTDEPLPNGYNISTKGLCLKYPTFHKNNIIIMDTPGLDFSPVFSPSNSKEEVDQIMKDQEKTIEFLQKFIILNSNIILCVVGEMTTDDQKSIELIKCLAQPNQIVIIVHNLYCLSSLTKIQMYLSKIISENAKNLQENTYIQLNEEKIRKEKKSTIEENKIYYNETYKKSNYGLNLVHVIIANQNTEAGLFYNPSSFSFIRDLISTQTTFTKFPVFEKLKEFIIQQYPILFGKVIASPDLICIEEDSKIYSKCNLMENKDESDPNTLIIPRYCYYITQKEIIIRVECSNTAKSTKIKAEIKGPNTIVRITGTKVAVENPMKDRNKASFNNIMCGKFAIDVAIPLNDAVFASKNCQNISKADGYLQFVYPRMTNDNEESN